MERLFDSPLFLGFERFEQLVDAVAKAQNEPYPPYNIEQIGEYGIRITLALAGFRRENVRVTLEDNKLCVRGKQESDPNAVYIHKGIANRQFVRTFVLADGMEVVDAELENGLLNINLTKVHNEAAVRDIPIKVVHQSDNVIRRIEDKSE